MRCKFCNKHLTDAKSIKNGYGPECAAKALQKLRGSNDMFALPDYEAFERDGVVVVIDKDNGPTVTNRAEEVIAALVLQFGPLDGKRVIYRDTDKVFDELAVENGRFAGFKPIRETELDAALTKVKGHH